MIMWRGKLPITPFLVTLLFVLFAQTQGLELLRWDVLDGFNEVSGDLGDYEFFTCTGEGSDRSCKFNNDEAIAYARGVGFYAGINIVAIVVVLLIVLLNICVNLWSCLCGCLWRFCKCCFCGCCSKRPVVEKTVNNPKAKYTSRDYFRMTQFGFVILGIPILFCLGHFLGNVKISENSAGLLDAPAGFQGVVMGVEPPLTNTMIGVVSEITVPAAYAINDTFNQAVNISELIEGIAVVNATTREWPQVQTLIDIGFDFANMTTDASVPIIDNLITEFTNINDTVNTIIAVNNNLTLFINDIDTVNQRLTVVLSDTNASIISLRTSVVNLLGDGGSTTGLIPSVANDLEQLPAGSVFTAASTAQQGIVDTSLDGDSSGISTLVTELQTLGSTIGGLPNFGTTADNLRTLNSTINQLVADGGVFDTMNANVNNLTEALTEYPSFTVVGRELQSLDSAVRGVNIFAILTFLGDIVDLFDTVPDLIADIRAEVIKMKNLTVLVDAAGDFTNQIYSINETILELSEEIIEFADNFEKNFNTTDLLADLDDIIEQIDDVTRNVTDYLDDAREYIDDASEFNTTLTDALNTYNVSKFVVELDKADAEIRSVNFTDTLDLMSGMRNDISNFGVDVALASFLDTLQSFFATLAADITRASDSSAGGKNSDSPGDYVQLARGHCSTTDSTVCDVNGDCPSGETCTGIGNFRCKINGGTSCTSDSDCSAASDYCLADSTFAATLYGELGGYSAVAIDGSTAASAITDLQAFNGAVSQLDAAVDSINAANAALHEFNVTEGGDLIQEINDGIKQFTIDTYIDLMQEVKDEMADLELEKEVEKYDKFGDHQRKLNDHISDGLADFRVVRDFLFDPAHLGQNLANLQSAALQAHYREGGPGLAVRSILQEFDNINEYFVTHFKSADFKTSELEDEYGDRFEILDKMGAYPQAGFGDMRESGGTYYLMRLFNAAMVLANDPKLLGVVVNSDHERYEDDNYCTVNKCEEHSMNVLNEQKLSTWSSEFPGLTVTDGIEFTREEIMMLLWIPPMLTVVFAIFVFVFNFKVYGECTRKCCTCLFMSSVFCQLPFILLFTAIFFALSMVLHDVCASGSGIGSSYLVAYGDELCTEQLGGEGTLTSCEFVTDIGDSRNITYNINILAMYDGLVAGECGDVDPFASVLNSIADQLEDIPSEEVDSFLNKNSTQDLKLRDPVKNILIDAAANTGRVFTNFFRDTAQYSLNCEQLSAISNNISGSTCGSFVTPTLWIIGTWYLAGWILVCCAFPAGCLKKRYTQMSEDDDDEDSVVMEDLMPEEIHIEEGNENNSGPNASSPPDREVEMSTTDKRTKEELIDAEFEVEVQETDWV